MKTRVIKRNISAFFTCDPEETARLMNEAEKVKLTESVLRQAADIAASVLVNTKNDTHEQASALAAYIMGHCYLLNRDGLLVEVSPKPRAPKSQKLEVKQEPVI